MNSIFNGIKSVFCNPISLALASINLGVDIWIHLFKPSVPGFRYDYFEEPSYFKVFRTVNILPETITGFVFYPIDHVFELHQHFWLQSTIFSLIFAILSFAHWAIVGYLLAVSWRSIRDRRV